MSSHSDNFDSTDLKVFGDELKVNVIGPVATLRAFMPLLDKGKAKKVLFLSTEMGSLTLAERIPFLSTYPILRTTNERLSDIS